MLKLVYVLSSAKYLGIIGEDKLSLNIHVGNI